MEATIDALAPPCGDGALLIIVVGGTIRIHDAGESCPDWPQCFGTWGFMVEEAEQAAYWDANPDQIDSRGAEHRYTIFEIFVEWFHRLLVGIIAVPILINAIVAQKLKSEYGEGIAKSCCGLWCFVGDTSYCWGDYSLLR